MTPIQRLNEIRDEYGPFNGDDWMPSASDIPENGTFCIIERNTRSSQTWITLWSEPEEAVRYHYGQEYAEDWYIDDLLDLATGIHYEPTHGVKRKEQP